MVPKDPDIAKKCDFGVFPATQGGPAMHMILAKAVAFGEASQPSFVTYQKQVLQNAAAMAATFQSSGIKVVSNGTSNHLFLLDLINLEHSGRVYEKQLESIGIVLNKNAVPGDRRSPFETSGLRIGTPAVTTRGLKQSDVIQVADWIVQVIQDPFNTACLETIRKGVQTLCAQYPVYPARLGELC